MVDSAVWVLRPYLPTLSTSNLVVSGWAGLGQARPGHMSGVGLATWPSWAPNGLWSTGMAHGGQRGAGPWTAGTVRGGPHQLPLSLFGL